MFAEEDDLRCVASDIVRAKCEKSSLFNEKAEAQVPRFHPYEIEHGIFLGAGGFCTVTELMDVVLLPASSCSADHATMGNSHPKQEEEESTTRTSKTSHSSSICTISGGTNNTNTKNKEEQETTTSTSTVTSTSTSFSSSHPRSFVSQNSIIQDRSFIAKYHQRDGHARYAIKMLSKSTLSGRNSNKSPDHKKFIAGVVDLAPCSDSFFIILDRLYDTLSDRIKGWKNLQRRLSGLGTIRDLKGTKKEQALGERLVAAYNICSALQYLHQNNIIYRDLKPDNIGFDVRDDVKIFDFGLAAEMHPSLRVNGTNTYRLTAESGSPRYMAPEVALGQPYNHLVDVYSFSLLLWEMCMMKTPFDGYDLETLNKKVFKGGYRPELNSKWNKPLKDAMEKCWSHRITDRLECDEIMSVLSEEIMNAYGGDDAILDHLNVSSKTEASVNRRASR